MGWRSIHQRPMRLAWRITPVAFRANRTCLEIQLHMPRDTTSLAAATHAIVRVQDQGNGAIVGKGYLHIGLKNAGLYL